MNLPKDDDSGASTRLTPWDEAALGIKTAEILHIRGDDEYALRRSLEQTEHWARSNGVEYLFGRVDANDAGRKLALISAGFSAVECSITLSRHGFSGLPAIPVGMHTTLRAATVEDLPWMQEIAREDFHHGRFLEDPALPEMASRFRTALWVADLVDQGLMQAVEARGKCIGFHAERARTDTLHADLILTGARQQYSALALPLWAAALQSLSERGFKSCATLVSAANTGVINLYGRLGFHFDKTLLGYRKFL